MIDKEIEQVLKKYVIDNCPGGDKAEKEFFGELLTKRLEKLITKKIEQALTEASKPNRASKYKIDTAHPLYFAGYQAGRRGRIKEKT